MKAKLIKTEKDYNEAVERIYRIMHSSEEAIDPGSPEGEEMELLSLLVEKYEQEKFALGASTPIEAIRFRMDQMDLKQKDIAPLFGGKTRVSEVLNGKRQLTMKMIILLHSYLGIPYESLFSDSQTVKLESEKKEKLLKNPSIQEYLGRSRAAIL
jgi:HTH-type transcriptional regulator/antitoxin HigA